MLLVHHHESQFAELHRVFNHGVCSHEDVHAAAGESVEHGLAPFALHDAGEQFHPYVHVAQKLAYRGEMLFGENFRRCHYASLVSVVESYQHCHQCHESLSAAHVALQQPVHLPSAAQVAPYLPHHPFLGVGE